MDFGFTSVAAITVICYLVAEIFKVTKLNKKWLPVICGVAGGILGVCSMYLMPSYPSTDIINAVAIGIVSGFAATGVNQIVKQFYTKKK